MKVAVLGASGGIGQPLSLLLKLCPYVTNLALYDIVNTLGVAKDLSHISTSSFCEGHLPAENGLKKTLTGAKVVIIPAGLPRKPDMTRDDLFKSNAKIVQDLAKAVAEYAPNAFILLISNPLNSLVPVVVKTFRDKSIKAERVFGVTTLDSVRASRFVYEIARGSSPRDYSVPIVGGHSGITIVPLLSQMRPKINMSEEQLKILINRVQFGGDEVLKAKQGNGTATLSMAYAGFDFAEKIMRAITKNETVSTCAYVYLPDIPGGDIIASRLKVKYFATPIDISARGIMKATLNLDVTNAEDELLRKAIPDLEKNIESGENYGKQAAKI